VDVATVASETGDARAERKSDAQRESTSKASWAPIVGRCLAKSSCRAVQCLVDDGGCRRGRGWP
jgi:hypothetical protein